MSAENGGQAELPEGWEWKRLEEVVDTSSGGTPSRKRSDFFRHGTIPWLKIGDLNDEVVTASEERITDDALAESSARKLPAGTLLIAMYGSIGKLGILGMEAATNQAICALETRDEITRDFLYWYLRSQQETLLAAGFGGTQANISQSFLRKLSVPVPPVDEQQRITSRVARWLNDVEDALEPLGLAASRLRAFSAATLQEAVATGTERGVGDLLRRVEAGRSFKCHGHPAPSDRWGVVKVSAMTWGDFREDENKEVLDESQADGRWEIRAGDVLISRANTSAYVGAAVLVHETRPKLLLSDKSLRLVPKPDEVSPAWLYCALNAPTSRAQLSALATGTSDSMRNLSQDKIRAVRLRVPSLEGQERLAQRIFGKLSAGRGLGESIADQQGATASLRRAILREAMWGRLSGVEARSAA